MLPHMSSTVVRRGVLQRIVSKHPVTVMLRLYRQGDKTTRVRCLNIIDRLAEFKVYDQEPALDNER